MSGALPADGDLGAWLAGLRPGMPEFAATARAAVFLLARHQRQRETFYADLCEALLPAGLPIGSVVDLGCGAGNLAFELAERTGAPVTGLDSDPWLVRWGERLARGGTFPFPVRLDAAHFGVATMENEPSAESVRFVLGDLHRPPFVEGAFGLACLVNVLDSLPDPAAALKQAAALVRPGGWLLFASPDSWHLSATPRDRWRITPGDWDALFASAGLETVRCADDLEWRLKDTGRLHHLYRVHGRLLRKG